MATDAASRPDQLQMRDITVACRRANASFNEEIFI
jgi:hypothetical protein